jgi:hypothetical protein
MSHINLWRPIIISWFSITLVSFILLMLNITHTLLILLLLFPTNLTPRNFKFQTSYPLKSTILWDIAPCSPCSHCACHLLSRWFLAQLIFWPWRWRTYDPPKRWLTSNGLHGVITQKVVLFITIAVSTSNLHIHCSLFTSVQRFCPVRGPVQYYVTWSL